MTNKRIVATVDGGTSSRPNGPVPPFSFGGVLVTGGPCAPYKFRGFKVVTSFVATLAVAEPSTPVRIGIYKNKDTSAPLSWFLFKANAVESEVVGPFRFVAGDYLQMGIEQCGTTGAELLVHCYD